MLINFEIIFTICSMLGFVFILIAYFCFGADFWGGPSP